MLMLAHTLPNVVAALFHYATQLEGKEGRTITAEKAFSCSECSRAENLLGGEDIAYYLSERN